MIDNTLKPAIQCGAAAKAANQKLGLIYKTFHYRTKATIVPLFKSLVRPTLKFAIAAWNPWLEKDVRS